MDSFFNLDVVHTLLLRNLPINNQNVNTGSLNCKKYCNLVGDRSFLNNTFVGLIHKFSFIGALCAGLSLKLV